jgi:hypothetical protein
MSVSAASGTSCISILTPYIFPASKKYFVFYSVRSGVFGFCKSAESSIPVHSNTIVFARARKVQFQYFLILFFFCKSAESSIPVLSNTIDLQEGGKFNSSTF